MRLARCATSQGLPAYRADADSAFPASGFAAALGRVAANPSLCPGVIASHIAFILASAAALSLGRGFLPRPEGGLPADMRCSANRGERDQPGCSRSDREALQRRVRGKHAIRRAAWRGMP